MTTTQIAVLPTSPEATRLLIASLRQQGASWNRIANAFNDAGVATLGGGARWWPATVQWAAGETTRQTGVPASRSARRTPTTYMPHARTFGVEVEWDGGHVNYTRLANAITTNGVSAYVDGYTHAIPQGTWRVMSDGSCSGEVVSPVLSGEQGMLNLKTVMQTMKAEGCGARRRASVHVHVGVLDFDAADIARLVRNMRATEKALLAYVADSRLNNQWARPMQPSEWNTLEARAAGGRLLPQNGEGSTTTSGQRSSRFRDGGSGITRYKHWNFNPVLVYGTVEFRAHGATMNHSKIRPWIAVCSAIVEATKSGLEFTVTQNVGQMVEALVANGALSRKAATEFKRGVATRNAHQGYERQQIVGSAAIAA